MSTKSFKRPKRKLARVLVRPPTRPSAGAQTIREVLSDNAKLSRLNPIPKQYHTVINWGNPTELERADQVKCFNHPSYVARAINKLSAFEMLRDAGVRIPEFKTKLEKADGIWFARTALAGSGGVGITVIRDGEAVPNAPLYTRYIKKEDERRVHVAFGKVIFSQVKLRQKESEQTADQKLIRNHDNGWVFCPRPIEDLPADCAEQAIKAIEALDLDFGAVDIVVGKKDALAYVLEVNTAPGIESEGLKAAYRTAFLSRLGLAAHEL